MSMLWEERLEKVEGLKNMLVAYATGGAIQEREYYTLRRDLLNDPIIASKLPRFIRTCRTMHEFWGLISSKFQTYAKRREFLREKFDSLLSYLEQAATTPSDEATADALAQVDSAHIQAAWQKALERRTTDPEGAITAARTLLESTCKHILDEQEEVEYTDKDDLPKLYSKTAQTLNLSPSQHTEDVFKRILGGCHSVVEGLGTLRNRLSDAHGKGKNAVRPASRHAELAVNLAGTMATFLLATWESHGS